MNLVRLISFQLMKRIGAGIDVVVSGILVGFGEKRFGDNLWLDAKNSPRINMA